MVQKVNAVGTKVQALLIKLILTSFDFLQDFRLVRTQEGIVRKALTREQLEEGHPEGPNVRLEVIGLTEVLLLLSNRLLIGRGMMKLLLCV